MFGEIKKYLNLSLPKLLTFRWGWLYLLTVSIINIVMVYFLHPFGEPDPLLPHQPYLLTGFGLICSLMYILLYQLVPVVLKWVYKMENWTLALEFRMFGIYFVTMLLLNWVYASLVIPSHKTGWPYFGCIVCFTVMYQLLPVAFCTLLHLTVHLFKTQMAAKEVEMVKVEPIPDTLLDLTMYNAGQYPANEIRFFKVIGNYCYINYASAGKSVEKDLKISLKKMEKVLKPFPQFVRCHNQYIVNTDKIAKYNGPKRKMEIQLINCKTILPVSYRHADEIILSIKKRTQKG